MGSGVCRIHSGMVTSERHCEGLYHGGHYKRLQTLRDSRFGMRRRGIHLVIDVAAATQSMCNEPFRNPLTMKIALAKISIALLLTAGAVSALANPGEREAAHAAPQQQREGRAGQREALRGELQLQREEERRRETAGRQQESRPNAAPDQPRRTGRLSPEERRALRQQINEAGHDIYAPRH